MTKGEIDRLGDKIRLEGKAIQEETLQKLQDYRISHKETLSSIFHSLCSLAHKVNKFSIITYRVKRFESIIGKLNRYPEMKFSRMWDVAGCRCIFYSDEHVYRFKKMIEDFPGLTIKKEYDYIKEPQDTGYKSLHLFLTIPNSTLTIEVQIRNQTDHNWATLVEITDLLFDAQLKEYSKDKKLLQFHYLLSKRKELSIDEKRVIADTIKDYRYFEKLSDVFTRNYIQIRKQWIEIENQGGQYYLIETKKDEIPKINSFQNALNAEESYFNTYKTTQNANIVLTHLPIPNYNHISTAYSNYILTSHSFLSDSFEILGSLLEETLEKEKYFTFVKYYKLYNELIYNHVKNLVSEVIEINKMRAQKVISKKAKMRQKEKEWIQDLNRQVMIGNDRHKKVNKLLEPRDGTFLFYLISLFISNQYKKKFQKVLKTIEAS